MQIGRIEGTNATLGEPDGWNRHRDGICASLPVRVEQLLSGHTSMTSSWLPTMEEIEAIVAGAPIHLQIISSVHPPVCLKVGEPPGG
jgi:hypothetical protein